MRSTRITILSAALVVVAACGGSSSAGVTNPGTTTGGGITTPTTPTSSNAVVVSDDKFTASSIQVSPGTTVTWTWANGASLHNVTFSDGPASPTQGSNSTFQRTFNTAGTFTYVCTLHGTMTGTVLVK